MALVDTPSEMIERMFSLQRSEGFAAECRFHSDGSLGAEVDGDSDETIYARFKDAYFSNMGVISASRGKTVRIPWTAIARTSVKSTYRKGGSGGDWADILSIEGPEGRRIKIDLSNPNGGRSATRIQQLVEAMAKRWGQDAVQGLPLLSIEQFFKKARRDTDFAANIYPARPSLDEVRVALLGLSARSGVTQIKVVQSDPEDEGQVYASAIAVATDLGPESLHQIIPGVTQQAAYPADDNVRRQLNVPRSTAVWIIGWD